MADEEARRAFDKAKEIVQEAILRGFPNPERRGCPDATVLKRLASSELPSENDPDWDHVTHCSPCYSEFLDFRQQVKATQRRAHRNRLITVALAAAAVIVVVWIFLVRSSPPQEISAYLDLSPVVILRGEEQPTRPNFTLPIGDLKLTIRLPVASQEGRYQVELLRELAAAPVATGSGQAHLSNGITTLQVSLSTAALQPGRYYFGFRSDDLDWTVVSCDLTAKTAAGPK